MPPTIEARHTARSHSYRLDGQPVHSVTQLIKGGLPAPGLTYWAANSAAEYAVEHPELVDQLGRDDAYDVIRRSPWNQRDRAAVFGTDIHKLAQQLAAGAEVDVPAVQAAHVDQCLAFLDKHKVVPLVSERPVASTTWRYAGTFDLIADTRHGRALIDYKTSRSGPYLEAALQLAAYRHSEWMVDEAGEVGPMLDVDLAAVCWLRGDGYDFYPLDTGEEVFKLFLHCAQVTRKADQLAATFLGAAL